MSKVTDIERMCKDQNLYFEKSHEIGGHPYCIFFNSKTGSKEIFCRNLKECETAIDELVSLRGKEIVERL